MIGCLCNMNYHNITYPDQNNGDGLRVVLWLSGCSHHCVGCQNPQTWDCNSGILFDKDAKEELFRELNKDYISGLTLSGGDPLYENNLNEVLNLVNETRVLFPQKTIWLYTGYTWESIMNRTSVCTDDFDYIEETYIDCLYEQRKNIIKQCNVVVDGRYIDSQRDITLKWRGSSNQRVINIQKSILKGDVVLWEN